MELADPHFPVFVDSRIEIFPSRVWDQYESLTAGSAGWEGVLDRWRVRAVVTDHKQLPRLTPLLERSSDWRLVYRDQQGSIFLRTAS